MVGANTLRAKPVTSLSQISAEPRRGGLRALMTPSVNFSAIGAELLESVFRQCNEMSLKVTKRNSFPCTSAKNSDESGIFRASKKFLVSVKGLRETVSGRLQNRVPRFNSGRGLHINQRVWAERCGANASICQQGRSARTTVKPRASVSLSRDRFQQRCLQTSCWLVQLRLQAPVLAVPAGFACAAAVVGMQAF